MSNLYDRDLLQRFLFENAPIRGEIVHLNASWQEIIKRHDYPDSIKNILGEMAAATVLLSSTLKFNGSLITQIQGDGPLSMAVVESTSQRTLRAIAQWRGDVENKTLLQLTGRATLFMTIDPDIGERYQGIVDISSGDIAKALEDYMARSQQLQTRIWLSADASQASGMLLQKMPGTSFDLADYDYDYDHDYDGDYDADIWNRVTQLGNTLKPEELTALPFRNLLHRLYHEEDVRVFEPEPVAFRCTCTRERVRGVLRMLGHGEINDILSEQGRVGVNCQFCNHYYEFDPVDVEELFATDIKGRTSSTKH